MPGTSRGILFDMCGIVGVLSKKVIKSSELKKMNDTIIHRGPDDEGYFLYGNIDQDISHDKVDVVAVASGMSVAFGHRRLSIIDLSALGHQPMSYLDRYWITYNGEIYNHIELRQELETLGYEFQSNTDTEVILAAYDAWGIDCLTKFNGMWAFAIFDLQTEEVLLSRDRFAIKPLYYYQDNNHFIFASEIKSLLEHPCIAVEPNKKYLKEYLAHGSTEYVKETAFKNIFRFDFSSCVILDKSNFYLTLTECKFWELKISNSKEQFNSSKAKEIANDYYELLKDAVRIRLRADVDVGSALSGGLDSASIVYLIDEIKKDENKTYIQETFSTVHKSDETKHCDESYYINLITEKLKIKSNQIEPDVDEIQNLHTQVISAWETPPDGTGMAGMYTYRLVSGSKVIVTLDGQGADEQQGGYLHYIINYLFNLRLRELLPNYRCLKAVQGNHNILKLAVMLRILKLIFGKRILILLINLFFKKDITPYTLPLNEKLKKDIFEGLINLIHYSDSRSMYFSLESRMPFMDYRLVEFTAQIPAAYKIHHGWTKYFARMAFDKKLPPEITWRKDKMGWPMPDSYWFRGPLYKWLTEIIGKSGLLVEITGRKVTNSTIKRMKIINIIRYLNLAQWERVFFYRSEQQ